MQLDEQRLRFRDAMALSAAVNVVTTAGEAGRAALPPRRFCFR